MTFIQEKFNFPSRVEDEENPGGQTAQVEAAFNHIDENIVDNNADIPSPYLAYEEAAVETGGDNAMLSPPPVVTFQP